MIRSSLSARDMRKPEEHRLVARWRGWIIPGTALLLLVLALGGNTLLAAQRAHAQGQGRSRSQRTSPDEHLDVTFTTDIPGVDVILQGEKIGTTDQNGQLVVKLLPGEYRVSVSRADYSIQQRSITVSRRLTSFKFFMGQPVPRTSPTPASLPTPIVKKTPDDSTQDGSGNPPNTNNHAPPDSTAFMEILHDPKKTNQLKLDDWKNYLTATYQELARDPNNQQLKAQAQFAQGQVDFLGGKYADALQAFFTAQRLLPNYALASYGLGNVYLATNQPVKAFDSFQQAIRQDQKLGLAYKGICDSLMVQKKKDKEARAACAEASRLGYLSSDTNLSVIRGFIKAGRWNEAAAALRPLAAADNAPAEVFTLLGKAYFGLKQTIDAYEAYTTATKLDNNSAEAYAGLGEVQLDANKYEAAKEALERALTLDPDGRVIDRRKVSKLADEADKKLRKLRDKVKTPSIP